MENIFLKNLNFFINLDHILINTTNSFDPEILNLKKILHNNVLFLKFHKKHKTSILNEKHFYSNFLNVNTTFDKLFGKLFKISQNSFNFIKSDFLKNLENNTIFFEKEITRFSNLYLKNLNLYLQNIYKNNLDSSNFCFDNIFLFNIYDIDKLISLLNKIFVSLKNLKQTPLNQNILNQFLSNYNLNIIVINYSKNNFLSTYIDSDYSKLNKILNKLENILKLKIEIYFAIINLENSTDNIHNFLSFENINIGEKNNNSLFNEFLNNKNFYDLLNPLYLKNIYFLNKYNYSNQISLFVNNTITLIEKKISQITFNFKTSALSGKLWFRNLLINLKNIKNYTLNINKLKKLNTDKIIKYNPLNYLKNELNTNTSNKKTAILIGASPSLETQIYEIIKISSHQKNKYDKHKNFLIFAMDNSLSLLIKYKIKPDFIIILDSRSFVKLFIPENYYNIPLICPLNINFEIFQNFNKIYYFNTGFYIKKYGDIFKNTIDIAYPLTNIGSFSLMLLYYLKFTKILTFGIDYKFIKKKYYHKEAYFYKYYLKYSNFINNILTNSIKKTISLSEKKLFKMYKNEFSALLIRINRIKNISNNEKKVNNNNNNKFYNSTKNVKRENVDYSNELDLKKYFKEYKNFSDQKVQENYFPLFSYYFFKTNSFKISRIKMENFIKKFL